MEIRAGRRNRDKLRVVVDVVVDDSDDGDDEEEKERCFQCLSDRAKWADSLVHDQPAVPLGLALQSGTVFQLVASW